MPRKKRSTEVTTTEPAAATLAESGADAPPVDAGPVVVMPDESDASAPAMAPTASVEELMDQTQRPWRRNFETLAVIEPGISTGEDRKFAQVYIAFGKERPTDEQKSKMTEAGFRYRAAEKRWDMPATAASRVKAKALVAEFTGVVLGAAQGRTS